MRRAVAAISICLALGPAATGAQEFEAWEGKATIYEGEGGTKKVVDGVDFWANGSPPKKFELLGYISDRRHKTGLIGAIRMSGLEADVARTALAAGGDAVILVESNAETVGTVGSTYTSSSATATAWGNSASARGSSWSTGASRAVKKQVSRYAVIRYVREEPARHEAPQTTPGPQ